MAVSDADYRFLYVDVGAYGSEGDSGVFNGSEFGEKIVRNTLSLPPNAKIGTKNVPFFFIADDAFPLCQRIMKPYRGQSLTKEERIFNYRLSRARRCIENAFGILSRKWLCLSRTMFSKPDRVQKIVLACCCLHNYLIGESKNSYCPTNFADHLDNRGNFVSGQWRRDNCETVSLRTRPETRLNSEAKKNRDHLKNYFNSPEGAVDWQNAAIFIE